MEQSNKWNLQGLEFFLEKHIERKPTRLGKVVRKVPTNNHRERFRGH